MQLNFIGDIIKIISLLFLVSILLSGCRSDCAHQVELDYSKLNLARCESEIIEWKIKYGNTIYLPDSLTTITRSFLPYLFYSSPITTYRNLILFENYEKETDSTIITYIDTNGIDLFHYSLKGIFYNPQIIDDTLLLCTREMNNRTEKGVLLNKKGNLTNEYFFLLDPRFLIHYQIFDKYIFTVGFEDLKDHNVLYNRSWGCYSLDDGKHLSDGAIYPYKIYAAICIDVSKAAQFIVKSDTVIGVLAYAPIFFKHSILNDKEEQWLLPFYKDFEIWDFRNCDLDLDTKLLYKYNWSYQYYANALNDSVLYVFRVIRGRNPRFFIDFYNFKSESPIYLGSIRADNNLEPLCGWKNRIVFLDRKLLFKKDKVKIVLGYIEI